MSGSAAAPQAGRPGEHKKESVQCEMSTWDQKTDDAGMRHSMPCKGQGLRKGAQNGLQTCTFTDEG
eukprot:729386-Pelagomonas_calceolata.AAC.4